MRKKNPDKRYWKMAEDKHYSFKDGLPTSPDVTMLQTQWPDLKVGDKVLYSEIACLLGVAADSRRFWSVIQAWRKRMRDSGVILECERGEAFYVASAEQIIGTTYDVLTSVARKAKKHRGKLATVRDAAFVEQANHHMRLLSEIEIDAKKVRTQALPNTAAPDMPRIVPP